MTSLAVLVDPVRSEIRVKNSASVAIVASLGKETVGISPVHT
jgi:hypothetical protein